MSTHTPKEKSRQVELLISNLLRIGVGTSLAIVVIGTIVSFAHHPKYFSSKAELQRLTAHDAAFPDTVADSMAAISHGKGRGIVIVGLLLLVATPVMRVAVSILGFIYEEDWAFVAITVTVLALLLLSFALGGGQG
jgi:uncharacterized membrane protein